jgi:hypothetical protein
LIYVKDDLECGRYVCTMSRFYGHSGGAVAGILPRPSVALLRSVVLALTLAFLLAGFVHAPLGSHAASTSDVAVAAAGMPSHTPCGPHDGAGHGHVLCGMSASCFVCAPVDTAAMPTGDHGAVVVAVSDLPHRGRGTKPPCHPPKPLVIA